MTFQFSILSGKAAGTVWVARRFPVRIGRAPETDLHCEEEGVWDEHATVLFSPGEGIILQVHPDAIVSVNGQPVERTIVRNGDILELGALKLQFWLAEIPQRGLEWREGLTWAGIVAICLGQIVLIYLLLNS